jgi:hypothetical protein
VPHSSDVTLLNYLFWRFVNSVYLEDVQNVNELHERIVRAAVRVSNKWFVIIW